MQIHTCTKCGETKEISSFYKSKYNRSGYRGTCKSCIKTMNKKRFDNYSLSTGRIYGRKVLPTRERLMELFSYNLDGSLTRLKSSGSEMLGSITFGNWCKRGYREISVDGLLYKFHRVVWKINYDEEPLELDHINRNPSDNRVENLRPSNRSMNCKNLSMGVLNKSGFFGVHWSNERKKWVSQITCELKNYNLGRFENIKDAVLAYNEKCNELHGEFGKSKIIHNMEELKRRGLM